MGTSNWQNISHCVGILRRLRPESLLDVGCGFGRWGVLAREFLDVWEGREARTLWRTRIEGVEAFPACLTPLHGYVYDRLHVGDAVELLPALPQYDVVYMGDVVEHQVKPRALALLEEARRHARQAVVVTIPIGDEWVQTAGADGNRYHPHRSVWTLEDFDRYPERWRRVFTDDRGRMFLVVELLPDSAGAPGTTGPSLGAQGCQDKPAPTPKGTSPLMQELARCVDENLWARPYLDHGDSGIDGSARALFQLPSAIRMQAELERLADEEVPYAAPLSGAVDALFYWAVTTSTRLRQGDHGTREHRLEEVVERLSDAVSCIADCTRRDRRVLASARRVETEGASPRPTDEGDAGADRPTDI